MSKKECIDYTISWRHNRKDKYTTSYSPREILCVIISYYGLLFARLKVQGILRIQRSL
jgi:hypothetical protein